MTDATYFSPTLNDSILPTDGLTVTQPKEVIPSNTLASPVIPDKEIFYLDEKARTLTSSSDQVINGTFKFGTGWLVIDSINKRIIINDGKTDRILIGRYGNV